MRTSLSQDRSFLGRYRWHFIKTTSNTRLTSRKKSLQICRIRTISEPSAKLDNWPKLQSLVLLNSKTFVSQAYSRWPAISFTRRYGKHSLLNWRQSWMHMYELLQVRSALRKIGLSCEFLSSKVTTWYTRLQTDSHRDWLSHDDKLLCSFSPSFPQPRLTHYDMKWL